MLFAAPAPSAPAQPDTAGRRYVVAAIGDSLTDPRSGGGKYLKALAARCPESRFDAHGIGGQRTDHMRWRFAHDVIGRGYTHVIVLGGVNDLLSASIHHAPIARTRRNLSFMYRLARKHGISTIAITVPPWGHLRGVRDARVPATHDLNEWILARAEQGEVDFAVDIRDELSCTGERELCPELRRFPNDLVHWNGEGHRRVADAIARDVFADCR